MRAPTVLLALSLIASPVFAASDLVAPRQLPYRGWKERLGITRTKQLRVERQTRADGHFPTVVKLTADYARGPGGWELRASHTRVIARGGVRIRRGADVSVERAYGPGAKLQRISFTRDYGVAPEGEALAGDVTERREILVSRSGERTRLDELTLRHVDDADAFNRSEFPGQRPLTLAPVTMARR